MSLGLHIGDLSIVFPVDERIQKLLRHRNIGCQFPRLEFFPGLLLAHGQEINHESSGIHRLHRLNPESEICFIRTSHDAYLILALALGQKALREKEISRQSNARK